MPQCFLRFSTVRTPWDAVIQVEKVKGSVLEIEVLTAQDMVYIDCWVGFSKQVPRAFDTCSGIDQRTIHIEETIVWNQDQNRQIIVEGHRQLHRICMEQGIWHEIMLKGSTKLQREQLVAGAFRDDTPAPLCEIMFWFWFFFKVQEYHWCNIFQIVCDSAALGWRAK